MSQTPWYADGLRFECTQCGGCCSGEAGFVWVSEAEIARLAEHLQLSVEEFERRFVRRVGTQKSLVEYPDGDCIFLDPQTRRCSVYAVRPVQCRTWPFWDSNLESKQSWRETCRACPGSGRGRLYRLEEIEDRRRQRSM